MKTSINIWAVTGFYLVAAILSPVTIQIFKPFKNKIFTVSIVLLNLILCLQLSISAYEIPWSYLSIVLALSGSITLFFIPRQIFHKAVVLFLLVQVCLSSLLFSNHILMTVTFAILSGLLASMPFLLNYQTSQQPDRLMSILLWHRCSDLFILFSTLTSLPNISTFLSSSLFLTGIFIRSSPLILTTSLQSHLDLVSPAARTFYFFSMGFGSAILFVKSNLFFLIPENLKTVFIILYIFSALFALASAFLHQNSSALRADFAFLWIAGFHIATLTNLPNIAHTFLLGTCLIFSLLFNWKVPTNQSLEKEKSLWKSLLLSGWRIDSLIEKIFLKAAFSFAYFTRQIISPIIYILWIQIPQLLAVFSKIILRLLNAGGAQKAITVTLLALTLFLIYYAGI
jgi:hypothetical protein